MIVLKCVNGKRKDGKVCDYTVEYKDEAYVIITNKRTGGFTCPVCHKDGLKAFRQKSTG